jgi:serine/threonine protein phosphatase PrpC
MPAAAEAAGRALTALAETVGAAAGEGDLLSRALAGFDAANRAVLDMRVGAGTTLVAALVSGGEARVLHAGDSMAIVTGQRGRVRLQIVAHSPTGYGVEAGLLTEHEALRHEERSTILNVVGSEDMRVEIGQPVRLAARDTLLLASDGLCDNLMVDEIVDMVRAGPLGAALDALAGRAVERMASGGEIGHPDDLTMLAYRPTSIGG